MVEGSVASLLCIVGKACFLLFVGRGLPVLEHSVASEECN